jgi:hypothetical protein
MNPLPTQIVNPHHLTPKALKMAQGKHVNNITDADWESWHNWLDRTEIVNKIVSDIADQFKSWQG